MKRRDRRSLRLKYLLIILLLTAIVFISSTYAWFTTNKTVTVNTIDVNVQTVTGIQISVDGINWKSTVSKDELLAAGTTYASNINTIPAKLEPVSTALGLNDGQLDMFYGVVKADDDTGEYMLTAVPDAPKSAGTHYIVFDIFLKTTKEIADGGLYLTSNSGASCNGTSVGLENASRIAFIKQGNVADGATAGEIQSLKTTNVNDIYLWEPHHTSHTAAAVAHAAATYGITTTTSMSNNTTIPYSGIAKEVADPGVKLGDAVQEKDGENGRFKVVTPTYKTETGTTENTAIFGLSAGITKLRVYMWIEGQDVDCENNASGTDLQFNLKFTIDPTQVN